MDNIAPFLGGIAGILFLGIFTRVITILSILKVALGIQGRGFGFALGLLAFALAALSLQADQFFKVDLNALFAGRPVLEVSATDAQLQDYLKQKSDPVILEKIGKISSVDHSLSGTLSAFLLTQLKSAFQLGVILLLPFIVIDLLVSLCLTAVGVSNISAASIAVPLKLLIFVAVDGWSLIGSKILGG